jgi:hypothetical protein
MTVVKKNFLSVKYNILDDFYNIPLPIIVIQLNLYNKHLDTF